MVALAARDVGWWRLLAQRVVPALPGAADVVRHLGAVQAQDLRAAATAVAVRTSAGTVDGLAAALEAGEVVRSWPMRGTLHLVAAADLPWVLELCAVRSLASSAARRRDLGIGADDLDAARAIVQALLTGGGRATRAELLAALEEGGQPTGGQRGAHLIGHLACTGVVCLGPLAQRAQAFVLNADWIGPRPVPDDPLAEWTRRYLRGHGPATPADFAGWSKLALGAARKGFAAVREEFESVEVDGVGHLVSPEVPDLATAHRRAARGVHVLPGFDEFLLGYCDRSHVLAPEHAGAVVPGGNGVFRGIVVAAGRAVGTWSRQGEGIAAQPFTAFTAAQERAVARRATTLPSGRLPTATPQGP